MSETDEPFDPYRVLGVPIGADEGAIRRRYRELVRKHHPDVSSDSQKAHERFVRIQQAYRCLMDPQERARYERRFGVGAQATAQVAVAPPRTRFAELLTAGRQLLRERRLREAHDAVAEAIELDPFSAEAYRLLGDIYMAGGNAPMALELYREAKLLEDQAAPPQPKPTAPKPRPIPQVPASAPVRVPVLAVGAVGAIACLVAMAATHFHAEPGRFAALGCGAAFLLAAGGVASGLIETFDELLTMAEVRESGRAPAPGGLYLIVLSIVSPYAGVLFYGIASVVTETYSRGILKMYAITFAVALWAWRLAGGGAAFVLVAPSLSFAAALAGWLVGSFVAPREWWRR